LNDGNVRNYEKNKGIWLGGKRRKTRQDLLMEADKRGAKSEKLNM